MNSLRLIVGLASPIVTDAIACILSHEPGLAVVGSVRRAGQLPEAVAHDRPDVALLDPALPGLDPDLLRSLREESGCPAWIALETCDDGPEAWDAVRAEVGAYLDHPASRDELLQAVRVVARGETFLSPRTTSQLIARIQGAENGELKAGVTARELEILDLVAEGLSSKAIAHRLGVSVRTVETHRLHLMEKLGASSSPHLVRLGIRQGLIRP